MKEYLIRSNDIDQEGNKMEKLPRYEMKFQETPEMHNVCLALDVVKLEAECERLEAKCEHLKWEQQVAVDLSEKTSGQVEDVMSAVKRLALVMNVK